MGEQQIYEEYWKLTVEYSDIHGEHFIETLRMIVDFIDYRISKEAFSEKLYKELQEIIYKKYPKKDMASVRKSINQFVKLGFINYKLESYHENCCDFLNARTNRKRQSIFSKIVYSNSKFNASITKPSNDKQINFLIKTLEENGKLHKQDIVALMMVDISNQDKGFLESSEVLKYRKISEEQTFYDRKYNQVSYLWKFLKNLDDLTIKDDYLYFEEDAQVIFGNIKEINDNKRDNYLHRIYKNQLKEEASEVYGKEKCMVENLSYPSLVASHIKPFVDSSDAEAYDPNNGILLSRNMDILFDQGYISFSNEGKLILSEILDKELQEHLINFELNKVFLNSERKKFLNYHRKNVLRKIS